jgi:peptide/nickel transport system substrate-binding protein
MKIKALLTLVGSICLILVLVACTEPAPTEPAPTKPATTEPEKLEVTAPETEITTSEAQYGGVLKISPWSGPGVPIGWPPKAHSLDTIMGSPAFQGLVRMTMEGEVDPWLAESWELAPDKLSLTFHLRKGVKFHDGTDFNAEAVKFNFDALVAAKGPTAAYLTSTDVIDDYTVRCNFSSYANTIWGTQLGYASMVSPTAHDWNLEGKESMYYHPVGTGPFEFLSHEKDVATKYVRFDDYWEEGKPYLDGVEWIYIADPMTQSAALQAGDVNMLYVGGSKIVADLRDQLGFEVLFYPQAIHVTIPDGANPGSPWADKRVRQALDYAIDKEAFAHTFGWGFGIPAYQSPAEGQAGYIPGLGREYDLEKAKQLLAEAGYPDGFETTIFCQAMGSEGITEATAIQGDLAKVGITARIEKCEPGKWSELSTNGWQNGLYDGMIDCVLMAETYARYFHTGSNTVVSMYRPGDLDQMIEEACKTEVPEDAKLQPITQMIFDEACMTTLMYHGGVRVVKPGVLHDTGIFKYIWKDAWTIEDMWMSE